MEQNVVRKENIAAALRQAGLEAGDLTIVHSSLSSFGYVEGGAQTVLDAFDEVLTREGTLVMPTFVQVDLHHAYESWYMDKPSDTGYLTEYFRKQMYVYRSNHPTHSVAARGKHARELVKEHSAYGPHCNAFGEYTFADSSPWRKIPKLGGKILMLGAKNGANTMKHVLESNVCEYYLSLIKDPVKAEEQKKKLRDFLILGPWAWFSADRLVGVMRDRGMITESDCGGCHMVCMKAQEFLDVGFEVLTADPEDWFDADFCDWYRECKALF